MEKMLTVIYLFVATFAFGGSEKQGDYSNETSDHKSGMHETTKKKAGPNGGRVIKDVKPHLEFFINDEGKVKISFLDETMKVITPKDQDISVVGGDRSAPTKLSFTKNGDFLISDKALITKGSIPVILQIKTSAKAKVVRVKFQLNLNQCGNCKYKEYACICNH